MNKILIVSLLLSTSIATFGQKSDKNAIFPTAPYDSTANFLHKEPSQYLGQTLLLKGMPADKRELGYANFILNYKKDDAAINNKKNIYKCCDGYNSLYAPLTNKHFLVLEVLRNPHNKKGESSSFDNDFYLKLQELESNDILFYKYSSIAEYTFPFIVMGYLEKQKSLLVGNEYVFTDIALSEAKTIKSQKKPTITVGDKWKCIDIIISDDNFELSLLIQNARKQQLTLPLTTITGEHTPKMAYTAKDADSMRKRFGIYNYKRVLQQKIGMNMTQEACRLSWGEPLETKKEGKTEVWIYAAGNTLTFKNGRLIK